MDDRLVFLPNGDFSIKVGDETTAPLTPLIEKEGMQWVVWTLLVLAHKKKLDWTEEEISKMLGVGLMNSVKGKWRSMYAKKKKE